MMNFWIYVTNSDNWAVTEATNTLGVSERFRNKISTVREGDHCLVYVKQEQIGEELIAPRIVGAYEVISGVFSSETKIFVAPPFMRDEVFNLRLKLKPSKSFENTVEFRPLISKMSFIKNKAYWPLYFRGRALIQIPKEDYDTIILAAG